MTGAPRLTAPRSRVAAFIAVGLVVAACFAFFVSPHASSNPDGLEKVAGDKGFLATAETHAVAAGPLADYGVAGVGDASVSTGLAGLIGVSICFAFGFGLVYLVRRARPTG